MADKLKILLIDDDEEDFLIISQMISEINGRHFNLEWVNNFDEALDLISRAEHAVYLLDYLLGGRNGIELLEKAIEMGCKAPIIFLTAYGNYDIDLRAMKKGAADYLAKGELTGPMLERSIRYSVERKKVEEELKRHRDHLEELVKERTIQHAEARAVAERRAHEAEERRAILEALLEHIPEGIAIVDSPGLEVKALSRYALEMDGLPRDRLEGHPLSEGRWVLSRTRDGKPAESSDLPVSRAAMHGHIISNEEWFLKRADNGMVPILISAGPIRDNTGHVTGAVSAWRDISELKQIQKELQEAHDDLELRVYQRTLELAETMDSLRESETRLKVLASRLLRAQEDERKKIAREMHDSIGSSLTAVKFRLENAAKQFQDGTAGPDLWGQLTGVLDHCIEESRRIMTDLRPSILDDLGLVVTIGWFCRRYRSLYTGTSVEETVRVEESKIPEPLKITIFRIVQEAMNNAAKYSKADTIGVSLDRIRDCISLKIEDNGTGFDLAASRRGQSGGMGLTSMKERAELSGGRLEIISTPGAGTKIVAIWELPRDETSV